METTNAALNVKSVQGIPILTEQVRASIDMHKLLTLSLISNVLFLDKAIFMFLKSSVIHSSCTHICEE